LYDVNPETDRKTKSDIEPIIENNDGEISLKWEIMDIRKGRALRIEW
jgi:hypothetical protein